MARAIKPKKVRFAVHCNCGYNSIDDSQEPMTHTHKEMLRMGFKYRKFTDGTRYYLSTNDSLFPCTDNHYEKF